MKTTAKKISRDENGKILILVLVLLVVGGLLLGPLLGLMSTGLVAGQVYEKKASELYAADAGVEDAIWQIRQDPVDYEKVPIEVGPAEPYRLAGGDGAINNNLVTVTIELISGTLNVGRCKVNSRASGRDGSVTEVEAYVQTLPVFWWNAITSTGKVQLKSNTTVAGGNVLGNIEYSPGASISGGKPLPPYSGVWPNYQELRASYRSDLGEPPAQFEPVTKGCNSYLRVNELAAEDYDVPLGFHDGNLQIVNEGGGTVEARLTGTVYISGDNAELDITGGNSDWTLDLNYQTIYVEGGSRVGNNEWALKIGNRASIKGSGVIIAEGNVYFYPNMAAGGERNENEPDDFIFVMSLFGIVRFQPQGKFYGSVAGLEVEVWPGTEVVHTDPPIDEATGESLLNFSFNSVERTVRILTWDIK